MSDRNLAGTEAERIDFVYPLGTASEWGNNEIRYSLRSIEKHFAHMGQVIIVGELPPFIDPETVRHIRFADQHGPDWARNTLRKVMRVCELDPGGKPFALMNDDFFLTGPVERFPDYDCGDLATKLATQVVKTGYYYDVLRSTVEILRGVGVARPRNFEAHYPMMISPALFLDTVVPIYRAGMSALWRSLYGNMNDLQSETIVDVKISKVADLYVDRKPRAFSSSTGLFRNDKAQKWIAARFPDASRFELASHAGAAAVNIPEDTTGTAHRCVECRCECKCTPIYGVCRHICDRANPEILLKTLIRRAQYGGEEFRAKLRAALKLESATDDEMLDLARHNRLISEGRQRTGAL